MSQKHPPPRETRGLKLKMNQEKRIIRNQENTPKLIPLVTKTLRERKTGRQMTLKKGSRQEQKAPTRQPPVIQMRVMIPMEANQINPKKGSRQELKVPIRQPPVIQMRLMIPMEAKQMTPNK